jgi:xanthine dehydrogenase YagR molybdenum-binding subunit
MSTRAAAENAAGAPAPRIDGRLKVTGKAQYAADVDLPNMAHAVLLTSAIAAGRIKSMDLTTAKALPGVLEIFNHENCGDLVRTPTFFSAGGTAATTLRPLAGPEIRHEGQIIALIVADTLEAARDASFRIAVAYDSAKSPSATLESSGTETKPAKEVSKAHEDPKAGDIAKGLQASQMRVEAEYRTPTQHHNPIELFSTTCVWSGDELTIYEPSQFVYGLRAGIAEQLGIDAEKIHVVNKYVGGAFGSKGSTTPRTALVAIAARQLGRPVKLVVTRDQGFTVTTYRAETRHKIQLGARNDGTLTAYAHEGWELTSRIDDYVVGGTEGSTRLYGAPNIMTKVNVVRADRNTPGFMRSPPEMPYVYALETAMDELAVALNMDPIELRRVNDAKKDPVSGKRFTSRSLVECFETAAESFGWSEHDRRPGALRDGDWLVGWGCAATLYPSGSSPAAARVRLEQSGRARVEIAAHDVGTGAYTVIGQMAAERLGTDLKNVSVDMGDSRFPAGPVAGGSITTASCCNAVATACDAIRRKLFAAAAKIEKSALSSQKPSTFDLVNGRVVGANGAHQDLAKVFERLGAGMIEEYAEWIPREASPSSVQKLYQGAVSIVGGPRKDSTAYAFGAELIEVRINAYTREIRVPRIVGAFAAGRIINPRTARSQYMGGMIWGIASALHESTELDLGTARYINDNLADYLVPVNADIDKVEVIFVPEEDKLVNPLGIKGIGELANVGTAAAISNAVYHATGVRVRKLPIRIEDILQA